MKPVYADEDVKRARHEKKNSTVYNPQLKLTCTCTTESGLYRRFVKLNNIKYTIRTLVKPDFSGVTADEWDLSRQTILEFDNFISRVRNSTLVAAVPIFNLHQTIFSDNLLQARYQSSARRLKTTQTKAVTNFQR